jgi:RHS repeat-associated protein
VERVRYSPFGVPTCYVPSDLNRDGVTNDEEVASNYYRFSKEPLPAYDDRFDINFDGVVDGVDEAIYWEHLGTIDKSWHAGDFRGEGRLSFTARELGGTAPGVSQALPQTGFAAAGQLDIDNRFGYAGYIWDQHLGIYHVRHRAYDPFAGRWLQPDPLALMGPELLLALTSSDGSNLYAYVGNNPNGFVDPFGLWGEQLGTHLRNNDLWWGPIVGTVVAVGGEFAESVMTLEGPREAIAESIERGIVAENNHAMRGGYEAGAGGYAHSIVAEFVGANEFSAGVMAYDGREDRFLTTGERWIAGVSGTLQVATAPIPGGGKAIGSAAKAIGTAAKAMKVVAKVPTAAVPAAKVVDNVEPIPKPV